jgi:hypothetical protein
MSTPTARAPTIYDAGAAGPSSLAIASGKPKMPLPIMLLRTSAVSVQRPIARTSSGFVGSRAIAPVADSGASALIA